MTGREGLSGWARFVEEILEGRIYRDPYVRIGATPLLLQRYGLGAVDLIITPGKIVRVARDHPEITRVVWRKLPDLLKNPVAIVPSARRDGSIIPVLVIGDAVSDPVLVPIQPDVEHAANIVLSVYGKADGRAWVQRELDLAARENLPHYLKLGFAATLPKPGSVSEDTIPSSPGPIPADGTAKPARDILSLRKKSS